MHVATATRPLSAHVLVLNFWLAASAGAESSFIKISQFPVEQQLELLMNKWDLLRAPAMISVLQGVIEKAEPKPFPKEAITLQVWETEAGIPDVALRRLNELSPEMAASTIRKQMASGNTRFATFAVRSLPAQDIPEADDAFSALLKENLRGALPLVAKFGTGRLTGQMLKLYGGELWPCAEEAAFTTYFARTQPNDVGKDVLKRAMADREGRGCYTMLLGQVAEVVWNPIIEAQAIITLNDSDPQAAMSAAGVLAAHGGPKLEPALWKRLEQWSEKWKGRTEELQTHPITGAAPNRWEEQLGSALLHAVGSAKSWVIDEPRRQRLLALCIDDWCRKRWASEVLSGTFLIDVSNGGEMFPAAFRLDGYTAHTLVDLKIKLEHFPAGTTFRWCP